MARPIRVQFHGSEKAQQLYFSSNAIAELEGVLGKSFRVALTTFGFREIRACLWAGMLDYHQGITIEAVGQMMDRHFESGGKLDALATPILEAWKVAVQRMGGDTKEIDEAMKNEGEGSATATDPTPRA